MQRTVNGQPSKHDEAQVKRGYKGRTSKTMLTGGRERRVAVLDVGTSKLCCLIGQVGEAGGIHVTGIGHHVSAGVKAGMVTDLVQAERAVRAVITQAEEMAGETIDAIYISLSAGAPRSEMMSVEVSVAGHAVEAADIAHVMRAAERQIDPDSRALVHVLPTCYSVDEACGIRNPEGMYGERLGLDLHLVTADPGPVLNLEAIVQRCHLNVAGVVAAPYAAGLGCLHEQEAELGAAVVDIGGGVTGVSVFYGGAMVDCGIIPMGSHALTQDLAKMLGVSLADAERLKTLHGSALSCDADRRETIEVTPLSEGNTALASQPIRRARIVEIIRPRLDELWEQIGLRLRACGFLGTDAGTVVLTGGGAQLPGLAHFSEQALAAPARLGYPAPLRGLAEVTSGPAFSAAVGLMVKASRSDEDLFARPARAVAAESHWPGRLVQWLRQSF